MERIEFYTVLHRDWWLRLSFRGGTEESQRGFLATIGTDIEYIGYLWFDEGNRKVQRLLPDTDKGCGYGTKVHGDTTVFSCKHVKQMLTCEESKPFLQVQREAIVSLRKSQEEVATPCINS